ncbi:MAG: hypothetical protein AB2L24_17190 [Mangrovibacterium sp.]
MGKIIFKSGVQLLLAFTLSGNGLCKDVPDDPAISQEQSAIGTSAHCYLEEMNGILKFPADDHGYKIPDYSFAGYMNSNCPLPVSGHHYQTVVKLTDPSGDETSRIQQAINEVSGLAANEFGYRGAVELGEGTWEITGLVIDADGVVLTGAGKNLTILQGTLNSPGMHVVRVGPAIPSSFPTELWDDGENDTCWNITSPVVNVGDKSFEIASGHDLQAGDRIIIAHPCTQEWLSAIGGGAPEPKQWPVGSVPVRYYRYVTAVNGNRITVDAPVMYSLVKARSQCYVFKYTMTTRKLIGIENMTVDADLSADSFNENHAKSCIQA